MSTELTAQEIEGLWISSGIRNNPKANERAVRAMPREALQLVLLGETPMMRFGWHSAIEYKVLHHSWSYLNSIYYGR